MSRAAFDVLTAVNAGFNLVDIGFNTRHARGLLRVQNSLRSIVIQLAQPEFKGRGFAALLAHKQGVAAFWNAHGVADAAGV